MINSKMGNYSRFTPIGSTASAIVNTIRDVDKPDALPFACRCRRREGKQLIVVEIVI
jgi:hypothetical protein